jgi:hypothetical protein
VDVSSVYIEWKCHRAMGWDGMEWQGLDSFACVDIMVGVIRLMHYVFPVFAR